MSRKPNIEKGFGLAMSVQDWAASRYNVHKIPFGTLKERLRRGYNLELALTLPKGIRRGYKYSDAVVKLMLRQKYLNFQRLARLAYRGYAEISKMMGN